MRIITFDLFGTVFDMANVPKEQLVEYGNTLRDPVWRPFIWPKTWETLPTFEDSKDGLEQLRAKGYTVIALSNAPLPLVIKMSRNAGITWDGIIPLEAGKIYKPQMAAYQFAADLLQVENLSDILMVSGNKGFEKASEFGFKYRLIRHPDTIIDLSNILPDIT